MIEILSDNIVSPLGFTSEENYQNVKSGKSGIRTYDDIFDLHRQVSCSRMDSEMLDNEFSTLGYDPKDFTRLEKSALLSSCRAIEASGIDTKSDRVAFYLSTTKGNVELLDKNLYDDERLYLWNTADKIANFYQNPNKATVVSNACISGICAIIAAKRAIESGRIDTAVVTGADVLSRFVVSGFGCLKALSADPCKPFDKDRKGLNLGEAAATVVLRKAVEGSGNLKVIRGSIRNDANHISGPSRTAEGAFNALNDILQDFDTTQIGFVSTHGTATAFNDEMESIAIDRMGLNDKPVNAFKGYYGHTLGAAGVLEAVIAKHSIMDNTVIRTIGFENLGTSKTINPTRENLSTDKQYFVKLISGFGGSNAAALFKKEV